MTSTHALVETNFLIAAFGLPHRQGRDAANLWSRFQDGEVKLHIPFLCFQEARNRILRDVRNPITELKDIRAYIESAGDTTWEDVEVNKFIGSVGAYLRRESTTAVVDERLKEARLSFAEGLIHGCDEIFNSMPVEVKELDLDYNDHLILASVLYRAEELTSDSEVYFCTTNYRHFAPFVVRTDGTRVERTSLADHYNSCRIQFLDTFSVP